MPAAPPAIFTPPSPGSPPPAAGAVFAPAPAGKSVLVISGVTTSGINGSVVYAGLYTGLPAWSTTGDLVTGAGNTIVQYTGTAWLVSRGVTYTASKTSAASAPDGLTAWTVVTGTGSPVITAFAVASPPAITA